MPNYGWTGLEAERRRILEDTNTFYMKDIG